MGAGAVFRPGAVAPTLSSMSFSEYFTAVPLDEIRALEPKSEPGWSSDCVSVSVGQTVAPHGEAA